MNMYFHTETYHADDVALLNRAFHYLNSSNGRCTYFIVHRVQLRNIF